ncbi:hypothetical protein DPMN_151675 [Dreissena polymorpha]|uniref:Uncharacterized protein n=1 Tax=Dreissena polymorpha TaxID=45954 RepID=A0A9D4FG25_DREPO|nr:hypothetical protein DPMN_151675 [Dreissena polymorpha]
MVSVASRAWDNIFGTNLLTKFHDDRTIIMAFRVLTRKNATLPWRPYIIGTNRLTKLHDDRTINVACRVLIGKNAPPPGGHVFKTTKTIFELIQDIIGTNRLTKKNAPPTDGNVFQPTGIIFKLVQDIVGMNLLTKFNEDRVINVGPIVKNTPPLGSHVYQANATIFKLIQDIIETDLLTKFHEDWTINVASRVKNSTPPGGHVFKPTETIFELIQDIIGTNLLTKFHEDQKINVESRMLTRKNAPFHGGHAFQPTGIIFELVQHIIGMNLSYHYEQNPLASDSDDESRINREESKDLKKQKAMQAKLKKKPAVMYEHSDAVGARPAPYPSGHASRVDSSVTFGGLAPPPEVSKRALRPGSSDATEASPPEIKSAGRSMRRLKCLLLGGNFVEFIDRYATGMRGNVASRVLTIKNAPPLGSHVFQANVKIFELIQDTHETNLLSIFHEDWTIHVASRVLSRQMLTPHNARRTTHDGQKAITKAHHEHILRGDDLSKIRNKWGKNGEKIIGVILGWDGWTVFQK